MLRLPRISLFRDRGFRIFWVILDQGVFALSNFVINILFARWLSPVDYGWFVLSFTVCMFITYIHWGAILEPLLVQSAKVPLSRRRSYVVSLVKVHLMLLASATLLTALISSMVAFWYGIDPCLVVVGGIMGGVAINTLATGRRLCAIFVSAKSSSIIGAAYLIGSVTTGIIAHTYWVTNWFDMWLIIGGWSLAGSIATFWLTYARSSPGLPYQVREIFIFALRYVHWGLGASVFGWLQTEGLYMILARFSGLETVAETRAVLNLAAPLFQLNFAAHLSALVQFSANESQGSKQNIWRIVTLYGVIAAVMFPIINHYSTWLVDLFYHGRYVSGAWQLSIYCVGLCMNALDSITSSFFKAQGRLAKGYASTYVAGTVAVALGLLLIPIQHSLVFAWLLECAIALGVSLTLRMRAGI